MTNTCLSVRCTCYPGRGPTLAHSRLYPTTPAPPGSWGKGQRYHQGKAVFFTSLALSPEPRFQQREQYRALHLGRLQEALEQSYGVQSPWGRKLLSRFSIFLPRWRVLGTWLSRKGQWLHEDPLLWDQPQLHDLLAMRSIRA